MTLCRHFIVQVEYTKQHAHWVTRPFGGRDSVSRREPTELAGHFRCEIDRRLFLWKRPGGGAAWNVANMTLKKKGGLVSVQNYRKNALSRCGKWQLKHTKERLRRFLTQTNFPILLVHLHSFHMFELEYFLVSYSKKSNLTRLLPINLSCYPTTFFLHIQRELGRLQHWRTVLYRRCLVSEFSNNEEGPLCKSSCLNNFLTNIGQKRAQDGDSILSRLTSEVFGHVYFQTGCAEIHFQLSSQEK